MTTTKTMNRNRRSRGATGRPARPALAPPERDPGCIGAQTTRPRPSPANPYRDPNQPGLGAAVAATADGSPHQDTGATTVAPALRPGPSPATRMSARGPREEARLDERAAVAGSLVEFECGQDLVGVLDVDLGPCRGNWCALGFVELCF